MHQLKCTIERILNKQTAPVFFRVAEEEVDLHFLTLSTDLNFICFGCSLMNTSLVSSTQVWEDYFSSLVASHLEFNLLSASLPVCLARSRFVLNRRGVAQSSTSVAKYKGHSLSSEITADLT